jgi:hypothetical protein
MLIDISSSFLPCPAHLSESFRVYVRRYFGVFTVHPSALISNKADYVVNGLFLCLCIHIPYYMCAYHFAEEPGPAGATCLSIAITVEADEVVLKPHTKHFPLLLLCFLLPTLLGSLSAARRA